MDVDVKARNDGMIHSVLMYEGEVLTTQAISKTF